MDGRATQLGTELRNDVKFVSKKLQCRQVPGRQERAARRSLPGEGEVPARNDGFAERRGRSLARNEQFTGRAERQRDCFRHPVPTEDVQWRSGMRLIERESGDRV